MISYPTILTVRFNCDPYPKKYCITKESQSGRREQHGEVSEGRKKGGEGRVERERERKRRRKEMLHKGSSGAETDSSFSDINCSALHLPLLTGCVTS